MPAIAIPDASPYIGDVGDAQRTGAFPTTDQDTEQVTITFRRDRFAELDRRQHQVQTFTGSPKIRGLGNCGFPDYGKSLLSG